jgi:hypothetical protein
MKNIRSKNWKTHELLLLLEVEDEDEDELHTKFQKNPENSRIQK